ncbi:hypothetical protein LV779_38855 [Streptomyces thinghirensis]|nr:hypothetical protein [Streptomyces thinghirensis]
MRHERRDAPYSIGDPVRPHRRARYGRSGSTRTPACCPPTHRTPGRLPPLQRRGPGPDSTSSASCRSWTSTSPPSAASWTATSPVADVAAARTDATLRIRVLHMRHSMLRLIAQRGSSPEETVLMHRLTRLTSDERRRMVTDFIADLGTDTLTPQYCRAARTRLARAPRRSFRRPARRVDGDRRHSSPTTASARAWRMRQSRRRRGRPAGCSSRCSGRAHPHRQTDCRRRRGRGHRPGR